MPPGRNRDMPPLPSRLSDDSRYAASRGLRGMPPGRNRDVPPLPSLLGDDNRYAASRGCASRGRAATATGRQCRRPQNYLPRRQPSDNPLRSRRSRSERDVVVRKVIVCVAASGGAFGGPPALAAGLLG